MQPRKLYRPKPLEPVIIVWRDAHYDNEYDGDPAAYHPDLATLHEAGFFVRREKQQIILASCLEPETGTTRRYVTIPRVLVREIIPLTKGEV